MGITLFFVVLFIIMHIYIGHCDFDSISYDIGRKGGILLSKKWKPFGPGWRIRGGRIYKITYWDNQRNKHEAYVKTTGGADVYYREDKIIEFSKSINADQDLTKQEKNELLLENQRLKNELDKLRRKELNKK